MGRAVDGTGEQSSTGSSELDLNKLGSKCCALALDLVVGILED